MEVEAEGDVNPLRVSRGSERNRASRGSRPGAADVDSGQSAALDDDSSTRRCRSVDLDPVTRRRARSRCGRYVVAAVIQMPPRTMVPARRTTVCAWSRTSGPGARRREPDGRRLDRPPCRHREQDDGRAGGRERARGGPDRRPSSGQLSRSRGGLRARAVKHHQEPGKIATAGQVARQVEQPCGSHRQPSSSRPSGTASHPVLGQEPV